MNFSHIEVQTVSEQNPRIEMAKGFELEAFTRRPSRVPKPRAQSRDLESRWRRGRDSNPRYPLRYVRFRGGSFQPLTHLSASDFQKNYFSAHGTRYQKHFNRWSERATAVCKPVASSQHIIVLLGSVAVLLLQNLQQ